MNQSERRNYMLQYLLEESAYKDIQIPSKSNDQKMLLRSLMNVRSPKKINSQFLEVQDAYLKEINDQDVITLDDLEMLQEDLYIYKGDITKLKVDAIVNAANSGMTGCYQPCHNCIDNCIHTYAGIQLRNYCNDLMEKQGHPEETGKAKITPGFNLPCKYVIHTVGPIVQGRLTNKHRELLKNCYRSCLEIAMENNVESIAFCCISTGVFMFPNDEACKIAVETVKHFKEEYHSSIKVIFNVFKDLDEELYYELLR